ncbi:MAG: hypothetical protein A2073_05985 [Deltaproteobacteria bacterium GWC2_42_11]|nr:MAG: hypothetical protein A2073_05985 [Deltaproteobacteria bacterium GWC2_42_11]HBO83678.1 hypothetical protein [Deltaproteobacteria bacterium]
MKKFYLVITLFISIYGCATIETKTEGNKIDKSMVESIKPGITTKKAIIEIFGYPSKSNKKDDETEEFIYNHTEKKVSSYFKGFIVNEKDAEKTNSTLEIVIKNDIVVGYRFIKTAEEK